MLLPLAEATPATSGGKAAALGALLRAGLPVPPGVVVPVAACRAAATASITDGVSSGDPAAARPPVGPWPLSPDLLAAIAAALPGLGGRAVAVRSSSTGEDTAADSGAGQHDSFLGVEGADAVAERVRDCWASLWSDRAAAYRAARGDDGEPATAVVVQRHVDAEASGVLFTADPGSPDAVAVVEASWGLGSTVVGGLVDPDTYVVTRGRVVDRAVGTKRTRADRGPGGTVTTDVPAGLRGRPCLDDDAVRRLVVLGERAAAAVGRDRVDVEWAVHDGTLWLLQARPVTADLPDRRVRRPALGPGHAGSRAADTLRGTPGSAGRATGPVRVVHGPEDFRRVRPGDILVCRFTDPAWTPLFGVVGGVITETGGRLSHAAIVAREHRIPAVLGVPAAMTTLSDGQSVTLNGTTGTIGT